jgi:hypothetical protein
MSETTIVPKPKPTAVWIDHTGRHWDFSLKYSDRKRLKAEGIDLFDAEQIKKLFFNPVDTLELIAECVRGLWDPELAYVEFTDLMTHDGNSLDAATLAFQVALADFFLRLGQKQTAVLVERAYQAAQQITEASVARIKVRSPAMVSKIHEQTIARLDREIDAALKKVERELASPSDLSTNGPESSN